MKRVFDLVLAMVMLVALSLLMLLIALAVKLTSKGTVIHWSERAGKNGVVFEMPKFRSMRADAPAVGSHLLTEPETFLTPIGLFIRRTSLDELPQLFSILKGDMSFVGPRPIMLQQQDFIALRKATGIQKILPGLTGWAQVNGRDELSIAEKVALDEEYMQRQSLWFDIKIIGTTVLKVLTGKGISH